MSELQGKRALVTGAASGIGRAIAERFAAAGAELLLVDRDEAALTKTAAELARADGRVRTYTLDVTNASRITGLHEQVAADGGPIDVLVNNAGSSTAARSSTCRSSNLDLSGERRGAGGDDARSPRPVAGATGTSSASRRVGYIGLPFRRDLRVEQMGRDQPRIARARARAAGRRCT